MTSAETPVHVSFPRRIGGALGLAPEVFRDIERDPRALVQAAAVVVAAGAARGIGAFSDEGRAGLVGSAVVAVATWLLAGTLIWLVGVKRFACRSELPEVLRTLGFAAAPLLLLALGALPLGPAHPWLWVGAHVWATLALAVATREALDVGVHRALAVCVLALAVGFALLALMGVLVAKWGAFD
ncbi:MAG: YIP1 family protein [Deltaproteobacteria bacterium]|nr:YIP1 family protein [Deltaproteobacteria bacterium]MBW2360568.1 YIP1 family protein [Deltaproteobacteria bacterium]